MAYHVDVPAILQVQILGRLDGQRTRSVFHYMALDLPNPVVDGISNMVGILGSFATNLYTQLQLVTSSHWTCEYFMGQYVHRIRYRAMFMGPADFAVPATGAISGACEPSGAAVRVNAYTELAGKQHQGGHWFPGIPASVITDSVLPGGTITAWGPVGVAMTQGITDGAGNVWTPCIPHHSVDDPKLYIDPVPGDAIADFLVRPELRYQRRREVGRGE